MRVCLTLLVLGSSMALKISPLSSTLSRRAIVTGIAAIPAPSLAAELFGDPSSFEYKTRDYGNGADSRPSSVAGGVSKKPVCEEGQRLAPDGFGGKVCKGQVKPVLNRVVDGIIGDDSPPSVVAAPKKSAPSKNAGESTRSSSSSSKSLTFEELLANSIEQKEKLLGAPLTAAEKADLELKLRALMSK